MLDHPEIQIREEIVAIPENSKAEFYRLFDDTRLTFLKSRFPRLSDEMNLLANAYLQEQECAKKRLGLKEISIPITLRQFLQAPHDCLKRECFDPLFQLLKRQIEPEAFEKTVSIRLQDTYGRLTQSLYRKWVMLVLLNTLGADRNYGVKAPNLKIGARGPMLPADPKPVPRPHESKTLSLIKEAIPAFIVPDIIFRSQKSGQYISFKSGLGPLESVSEALWIALQYSRRKAWYDFSPARPLPGLTQALLIYKDRFLKDAALIADARRICRPDLVIECVTQKDQLEEVLIRISHYQRALEPKQGTFIILMDSITDNSLRKRGNRIYLLKAGLNAALLRPVTDLLQAVVTDQLADRKTSRM